MGIDTTDPKSIQRKSFDIIRSRLESKGALPDGTQLDVIIRCNHTTADFDYEKTLAFSSGAIEEFCSLVKSGAAVVTDTNMALAGINKKRLAQYGGQAPS